MNIGTDIVNIQRIEQVLAQQGERFLRRILTSSEQEEYQRRGAPVKFLANRFAGKEAIAKALGTGIAQGVTFQGIEILPDELGAPRAQLHGVALAKQQALGAVRVHISLADEHDYVVAFAVIA
ncbi:holo-ACP synthase [Saccharospirillum alexandrii]|uniref:holo-ACP synthase n=1 Tax=Saccharospirillum alexandrii TaxID=2448477 RepID=UPI000FDBA3DB|nr:holo-ACP synthase [Saccharospirillum alexandrii]